MITCKTLFFYLQSHARNKIMNSFMKLACKNVAITRIIKILGFLVLVLACNQKIITTVSIVTEITAQYEQWKVELFFQHQH